MKNVYLKYILLSVALTSSLLFTACGKKSEPETIAVEETVTAITREQFMTLYENANSIYAVSPELFTEDADISIIDLPEISDTDIPISEAITLNEAIQILQEDNIPRELLKEIAESKGIITDTDSRWDEALTKSDFMELLTNAYSALPTVTNADRGAMEELAQQIANYPEDGQLPGFEEGEYTEADNEPVVDIEIDAETNASILEDYKAMYERGEISKETYEFMVDFNEEADNFIKENGSTSTAEVDNSMNQDSSNTVTIPDELLEGAVTTTPEQNVIPESTGGLDGYRDPDLAHISSN